ncbi:NADH-quinone oxidoreductase subunit 15 [Deinococcus peraridilitoris]|uniref:NADH-quinone oxidoreductase chain 15 n=1 Tax=Deinococcus peraridilitoris (strain DSM 19664 / LMG 22246 / CIP 109416 / KR-200) TaxID=937777 RepID=L0A7T7_DEIPD|nr:NADH-quinone oxidoreductase subunit 15 [Deinococcus peraridilitoris]AFZ69100.1 NADH-quinone oxidoreductase chain 15 [Deinococcus peraridilitoris DSM 19664]
MAHNDTALYQQWIDLLGWMQDYAQQHGLSYEKISDFPDYIYRMERPYDLPTTVASAGVGHPGQPLLIAAVSPRHVRLKGVQLRLMGGSKHWHLHAGDSGLLEGKRPFTRERLFAILDGALMGVAGR